jgi:hypothetical protein
MLSKVRHLAQQKRARSENPAPARPLATRALLSFNMAWIRTPSMDFA